MVCKLFGIACIVEIVRERLGMLAYTLRYNLSAHAKKIARMFLLVCIACVLLGLGLSFLLLGLAYWLNIIFSSLYLGFFLVSIFCFLMVAFVILMLRRTVNSQAVEQGDIMDNE
ncbi:MAG: phage holin family protein [Candidatus Cardinium sp.]|uniref:phage holin family protein n=1 Tax=Cardinium endosymbiont of Dermatophagoides farinae TaxID=2597823 RepID=UPI001183BA99|nr:phage holin family protein [Cardinium endosymbiont of Dermatophagoides farinae]TSJ80911.1 hypothetical protein FPG78_02570 [Cardinium endosymbiont of Dermatophagoides farinae]UWW96925.1 MAG: phage holin family protein [Candidatus Cardinium sp.]